MDSDEQKKVVADGERLREELAVLRQELGARRAAEEVLRREHERYRQFFESSDDAIFVVEVGAEGRPGGYVEVNHVACQWLGYSRDELLAMSPQDLDMPEEAGKIPESSRAILGQRRLLFETVYRAKDGRRIPVEVSVRLFEHLGRRLGLAVARDVSQRRQAEERSRLILKTSLDGFWLTDAVEGRILEVNDAYCHLTGYTREELTGKTVADLEATETPAETASHIRKVVEQGGDRFETRHRRRDGSLVDLEVSVNHLATAEGGRFFSFLRDIGERRRATEAMQHSLAELRHSEEHFRSVVETAPDAVIAFDSSATIISWNPGAEAIFGSPASEMIGSSLYRLAPAYVHPLIREDIERACARPAGERGLIRHIPGMPAIRADGSEFLLELSVASWRSERGVFCTCVGRDITDSRRRETEVRRQQAVITAALELTAQFLAHPELGPAAELALKQALALTASEMGLVAVLGREGRLRTLAISEVAWSQTTGREFYEKARRQMAANGYLEFTQLDNLFGVVLSSAQPLLTNQPGHHPGSRGVPAGHPPLRRLLAVPMVAAGESRGLICLANKAADYDEGDAQAIATLAGKFALFVEQDRLASMLRRRARFAETLQAAGARLAHASSRRELLDAACRFVVSDLGYDLAAIVDATSDGLLGCLAIESSSPKFALLLREMAAANCRACPLVTGALGERRTIVVADLRQQGPRLKCCQDALESGLMSMIAIPIAVGQHILGALSVYCQNHHGFASEVVPLLETFAQHVGELWQNLDMVDALVAARERAEAASRTKDAIMANVTHELRTPLNSVLGFTGLLLKPSSGPLSPKQETYVNQIRQSGDHLLSLVNDILDLAKLENGRVELERLPLELPEIIGAVAAMFETRVKETGIELVVQAAPGLPLARGDGRALRQILSNLLANAFNFTPDRGRIEVRARLRGEQLEVEVADSGCGIAAADLERIFAAFEQARPAYSRRLGGTGLGLALVRSLVTAMGGRVEAHSELGKGSRFVVSLPRA